MVNFDVLSTQATMIMIKTINHRLKGIKPMINEFKKIYPEYTDIKDTFCPYRVCPLGAHIDHQYGVVTGFALDKGIRIMFCETNDGTVEAASKNFPEKISFNVKDIPEFQGDWADYIRGAAYSLGKKYKLTKGVKALIEGTLPVGGLLEVHVALNGELFERLAFNDMVTYDEPYETVTIGKNTIHTLGINDNLIYLTAHYIRHFVNGGSSIRQMMDLLLYMKKYEDKIDFARYNKLLKELKYDKLIDAVKSIGTKYFGMDFKVGSKELVSVLLEDCEKCGLFGSSSDHSTNVNNSFFASRQVVSSLKLKMLFWFKSEHTLLSRLFPNQKTLIKMGYKYAKNKFLIPFAWIHKLFDYVFGRNKVRNEVLNTDVHNERIETMKKLSMID